ncbi:unnamed protein product [Bursaphelenchus xylophilus]|nr:unnamed protein product [Bursaphelenchus xylophilus]CAG9101998.1 unnamed protein product [Bursaphelenchus xylophilus]
MYAQRILPSLPAFALRSGASRSIQISAALTNTAPRHTLHAQKPQKERAPKSAEKPQSKAKASSKIERDTRKDSDVKQKKGMSEEIKEKADHRRSN